MTNRVVLDASAAMRLVLGTLEASKIADRIAAAELVLAPDLYFAEVGNALWKCVRAGVVSSQDSDSMYEEAKAMIDESWSTESLSREAFAEAKRTDHPVYDLMYAVLARRHGAALLTADRRLANLAEQFGLTVMTSLG